MKKHNFNEAIEIFKGMFEGWVVVGKQGEKRQIYGIDLTDGTVYLNLGYFRADHISHIEQTLPMNGDEVLAWDSNGSKKNGEKIHYIAKDKSGIHICKAHDMSLWFFDHVELISPVRKLTIEQATEMIKRGEQVNEPFEIIKE
jgi:hypothetical protein